MEASKGQACQEVPATAPGQVVEPEEVEHPEVQAEEVPLEQQESHQPPEPEEEA